MRDRTRDVGEAAPPRREPGAGAGLSRRRMLGWCAAALGGPPGVAAGSAGPDYRADDTAVLLALADRARADAALVVAAVTADPALAERLEPLRAARIDHAAALDVAGGRDAASVATPQAPEAADVAVVREAVLFSAQAASDAVPQATAARVGLLAEIAACCSAYGAVLA